MISCAPAADLRSQGGEDERPRCLCPNRVSPGTAVRSVGGRCLRLRARFGSFGRPGHPTLARADLLRLGRPQDNQLGCHGLPLHPRASGSRARPADGGRHRHRHRAGLSGLVGVRARHAHRRDSVAADDGFSPVDLQGARRPSLLDGAPGVSGAPGTWCPLPRSLHRAALGPFGDPLRRCPAEAGRLAGAVRSSSVSVRHSRVARLAAMEFRVPGWLGYLAGDGHRLLWSAGCWPGNACRGALSCVAHRDDPLRRLVAR